jgi:hypothetical protein
VKTLDTEPISKMSFSGGTPAGSRLPAVEKTVPEVKVSPITIPPSGKAFAAEMAFCARVVGSAVFRGRVPLARRIKAKRCRKFEVMAPD